MGGSSAAAAAVEAQMSYKSALMVGLPQCHQNHGSRCMSRSRNRDHKAIRWSPFARYSSTLLHTPLANLARPTTEYHTRPCVDPLRDYTHACPAVARG